MAREHLATYLNDHMAHTIGALEVLRELQQDAPEYVPELKVLNADIEADRLELKHLMDRLHISESRIREMGSWLAEKLAEFTVNVEDPSDGWLRRLKTLEALALEIEGKRALWNALETASHNVPVLQAVDYQHLIQRAADQRQRVEDLRLRAAATAFASEA